MKVRAIDHVVLNVRDVDTAAAWYERALGMERRVSHPDGGSARTSMIFGSNKINLRPVSASQHAWVTGSEPASGSNDLCFLTDTAPGDVARHFLTLGIAVESGPVVKSGALGPIQSVYVRDPDGNLIEVSSYR